MTVLTALLLAVVSLVYATVGQAGGTAFLAILALVGMPAGELRPSALALNIVAAAYATWRLHRAGMVDWTFLARIGVPALAASFLGGMVVLESSNYYTLTGCVLLLAAALMTTRIRAAVVTTPATLFVAAVGAGAGLASGVTGVGGGVFLAPAVIALGWTTAKQAASLSPPFILGNSLTGLAGVFAAGQHVCDDIGAYALAVLLGAAVGSSIGRRFMTERATRLALAGILAAAGLRLLLEPHVAMGALTYSRQFDNL